MKSLLIILGFFLLSWTFLLQEACATAPQSDPGTISFYGEQMGARVEGRFRKFSTDVHFNPADLAHSHAKIFVDLNSIDLSSDESEDEIKGKKWFNVSMFPNAVFQSAVIKGLGNDRYMVEGQLTIKGITRFLSVPMQVKTGSGLQVAEGDIDLNRLDFKVGEGDWADPDAVALTVHVHYKVNLEP